MKKMLAQFKKSFNNQKGQSMVEYALILGLIVVAAAAVMGGMGDWVANQFSALRTAMGI